MQRMCLFLICWLVLGAGTAVTSTSAAELLPPPTWAEQGAGIAVSRAAVLVAADQYQTASWAIPFAATNTDVVRDALIAHAAVPRQAIVKLRGDRVHGAGIQAALSRAASRISGERGLLVVFWTGHGFVDSAGEPHFFTHFTRQNDGGYKQTVARSEIGAWLAQVRQDAQARDTDLQTVLIVDACRTRTMAPPPVATFSVAEDWQLFSTKDGAFAEAPNGTEASPFTRSLVETMAAFAAIGQDRGLDALFPELRHRVLAATDRRQEPELIAPPDLAAPSLVSGGRVDAAVRLVDGPTGVGVRGTVTLDGEPLASQDGLWLLRTSIGRHEMVATAPGYLPRRLTIDLDRSHTGRLLRLGLAPDTVIIRGRVLPPLDTTVQVLGWTGPYRRDVHRLSALVGSDGTFELRLPVLRDGLALQVADERMELPKTTADLQDGVPLLDIGVIDLRVAAPGSKGDRDQATSDAPVADQSVPVTEPKATSARSPSAEPGTPIEATHMSVSPPAEMPAVNRGRADTAARRQQDAYGSLLIIDLDGVPVRMRWCPPGTFRQGSPLTEPDRQVSETQRDVVIADGFWICESEVTQRQWMAMMGDNPSYTKGGILPVTGISWGDVLSFLETAARHVPGDMALRLPTEAEWEYACRAGSQTAYNRQAQLNELGWYAANGRDRIHPVKRLRPNAWGLYDCHGNVAEWCLDAWDGSAYGQKPVRDPVGTNGTKRIFRGGSYRSQAAHCRSAARHMASPSGAFDDIGLRFILVPE